MELFVVTAEAAATATEVPASKVQQATDAMKQVVAAGSNGVVGQGAVTADQASVSLNCRTGRVGPDESFWPAAAAAVVVRMLDGTPALQTPARAGDGSMTVG